MRRVRELILPIDPPARFLTTITKCLLCTRVLVAVCSIRRLNEPLVSWQRAEAAAHRGSQCGGACFRGRPRRDLLDRLARVELVYAVRASLSCDSDLVRSSSLGNSIQQHLLVYLDSLLVSFWG